MLFVVTSLMCTMVRVQLILHCWLTIVSMVTTRNCLHQWLPQDQTYISALLQTTQTTTKEFLLITSNVSQDFVFFVFFTIQGCFVLLWHTCLLFTYYLSWAAFFAVDNIEHYLLCAWGTKHCMSVYITSYSCIQSPMATSVEWSQ